MKVPLRLDLANSMVLVKHNQTPYNEVRAADKSKDGWTQRTMCVGFDLYSVLVVFYFKSGKGFYIILFIKPITWGE